MQKAVQIISALGGPSKVAAETGIPVTTVHSWVRAKSIPHWRMPILADLAARNGVDIAEDAQPAAIDEEPETRIVLCGECGLRTDDPQVALCQALDCPRAEREAA